MFNASGEKLMTSSATDCFAGAPPRLKHEIPVIYHEDTRMGERHELGSFTFTAEAIKTFARAFDPQAVSS